MDQLDWLVTGCLSSSMALEQPARTLVGGLGSMDRRLIEEQIAYYRARAPEYDEWFFRQGRYDHGEAFRRGS